MQLIRLTWYSIGDRPTFDVQVGSILVEEFQLVGVVNMLLHVIDRSLLTRLVCFTTLLPQEGLLELITHPGETNDCVEHFELHM